MTSFSRLHKFFSLGPRRQGLLLQAWCLLGVTRLHLSRRGFSHFTAGLDRAAGEVPAPQVSAEQLVRASELGRLVAVAARYTPWESKCLTQVLVLQRLLYRRNIPGAFCLGVRRRDSVGIDAHAWLYCDAAVVNGASEDLPFAALSTFSWGAR
jgi:hypothetical protein